MKQWKLVLVALLSVLLVCTCMSALASETEDTTPPHQCTRTKGELVSAATCLSGPVYRYYVCGDEDCPLGNHVSAGNQVDGNALPHKYEKQGQTGEDTCTGVITQTFKCVNGCNDVKTEIVDNVKDHVFEYQVTVNAECGKAGYQQFKCKYCEATEQRNPKAALEHDWSAYQTVSQATCTEPAKIKYVCANGCGETKTEASGEALGHAWTNVEKKDPTCTEDGYTAHKKCPRGGCGITEGKETIAKTGHKFDYTPEVTAPTCTTEGYTTVWCSKCKDPSVTEKQNKVAALGHDWKLTDRVASACDVAGVEVYTCSRDAAHVDTKTLPLAAHSHDTWQDDPAATCYTAGQKVSYCGSCGGDPIYQDVPALGHDYPATPQQSKAATCTADGYKVWTCTRGGDDCPKVEEIIPATGHTKKDEVRTEPTCSLSGMKDIICADCGYDKVFERNVVIPANGHNGEWKVVVEATAEKDGEAHKICKVCGDILEKKTVQYTVMRYSNSATAFGPSKRELVGGSDWYRVTPIDLSVEGTFTYPLVASNQYVIGTVTVTIANGSFVVNYDTAASQIKVTAESLLVYADKAALAAGSAQEIAFGTPVAIGEDAKVILSAILTVDYNAIGAGVTSLKIDDAQIAAMIAIMD